MHFAVLSQLIIKLSSQLAYTPSNSGNKPFLVGLFLGELIFGGAYYWREFCVSK